MRRYLPFVVAGFVCLALIACQTGAGGLSEQDQAAIRKLDADYSKTRLLRIRIGTLSTCATPKMPRRSGRTCRP